MFKFALQTAIVWSFWAAVALAQWPAYRTLSLPRTADGKPNLTADAPKTSDGKPDLTGVWENGGPLGQAQFGGPAPGRGFFDIRPLAADLEMRPEAAALRARRAGDNSKDHPDAHCLPLHIVQLHEHPQPRKIIQTREVITILYEANDGLRQIFLDGRKLPGADAQPWWYGYSVGRWEGDTLVVESSGFRDSGWLDEQGTPVSDAAKITERFRRVNFGTLDIEVTVDDPKTFTKPFSFRVPQRLMPDAELIEFICLENQNVTHLVGK